MHSELPKKQLDLSLALASLAVPTALARIAGLLWASLKAAELAGAFAHWAPTRPPAVTTCLRHRRYLLVVGSPPGLSLFVEYRFRFGTKNQLSSATGSTTEYRISMRAISERDRRSAIGGATRQ